jgi:hypothetical protein
MHAEDLFRANLRLIDEVIARVEKAFADWKQKDVPEMKFPFDCM